MERASRVVFWEGDETQLDHDHVDYPFEQRSVLRPSPWSVRIADDFHWKHRRVPRPHDEPVVPVKHLDFYMGERC